MDVGGYERELTGIEMARTTQRLGHGRGYGSGRENRAVVNVVI